MSLTRRLLDVLVPPRCLGCGGRDTWLCNECREGLPRLPADSCRICAGPVFGGVQRCASCYRDPPPVARVFAGLRHDGVAREMVLALKYRRGRHLAGPLAELVAPLVPSGVDALVPVPLHERRLRERGFNQSAALAEEIADRARRPVVAALVRVRETPSQTGLSPTERVANVRGAFEALDGLHGRHVLLVDDVCTTGATLYACARALKRAGAASVRAVVVTRATYGVAHA